MITTEAGSPLSARAGDRDRQKAADQLGEALSQGYLAIDEYEDRVQATFQARTVLELRGLLADLPVDRLRRADPRRQAKRHAAIRQSVRIHLWAYLLMAVICLAVWLAVGVMAGAWYFWPVWPILGGAIGVAAHAIPVRFTTHPLVPLIHCPSARQPLSHRSAA